MHEVGELHVRMADGVVLRAREHRPIARREEGPDLLLVHGLASNALLWDGVGRALAAAGHRSIAVDLRAHGRSDAGDDLGFDRITDDLITVIGSAGLDRPIAVGQSWGGNVVVELAAARPGSVSGVVGVDGGLITLSDRFPDLATCWAALAPPRLDHLRWEDLVAGIGSRMAGWPDGAAHAQLGNLTSDASGRVRAILSRERHHRIVEHLYAHLPLERLATMEVPMLLLAVTGGSRNVLDERRIADAGDVARAAFDVVRLPGRDHDVHLQAPDLVADLVVDWLAGRALPKVA